MNETECNHNGDVVHIKIYTVAIGSMIAASGTLFNTFILYVFCRLMTPTANARLLQALAVFDIGVLVFYQAIYTVKITAEYNLNATVYSLWVRITPYVFPASRISQMATAYIMLVATVERFCNLLMQNYQSRVFSRDSMPFWIVCTTVFCVVSHVTRFWETEALFDGTCKPGQFGRWQLIATDLIVRNEEYSLFYGTWYTNIANIFIPFGILVILCSVNIYQLHVQFGSARPHSPVHEASPNVVRTIYSNQKADNASTALPPMHVDRADDYQFRRQRYRDSTMVSIVLVITYIVFNTLPLAIAMVEVGNMDWLRMHGNFYNACVEIINISAVTNSSIRIFNYLKFNTEFRQASMRVFGRNHRRSKSMILSEENHQTAKNNANQETMQNSEQSQKLLETEGFRMVDATPDDDTDYGGGKMCGVITI